ncbi:hypothetical protein C1N74_16135 (plasmid) [Microbacterium sp. SGAir0570]|uniref:hypothetical protein n=1 Tax=Microbacterium sp. SGAir0570 TaxID=2070348 RepID=UPI0010CD1556|nr:hypothetical protein [Microbacterium sp. SGAir0570]QCR42119.1 hypothetical protein C1N74_16135 [Microbacterium sp. SGAir0570]
MKSLGLLDGVGDIVGGAVDAVGGVVNFWSDPFGNMYKAGREATIGLSRDVIPAITESTLPNLSMPSFLNTYAVSFALSMMLAVLLLMFQFVRVARGRMSGQDLFESIGMYFPGFILGVSFGPAFGILLIELMRWLTRGIIDWAYGGTVEEMVATFSTLAADDPARITGGAAIGSMVIWAMAIGMLVIPLIFVFQLVVQYFMGVLIPLAVVWIVDAGRRASGLAAVQLWVGMLVIQPLLFLLLGFAFRLNIDAVGQWGNDGFKNLAGLLVAVIAIGLAVFAPFVLIGWAKKHLAGAPASDSTPTRPLGPSSLANVRHTPPRSVPQTSTPQAVRSAARPADAQGAVATKIGPQTAGAAGRGRAATATSSRAGASAASGAGTKAVGATAAGAAVAVKGAETVARKSSETAHTTVTPPPVHGKERPE